MQPTRTVAEMVRADEHLEQEFPLIKLPVFILHGSADKVTKASASQLFYEKAGSTETLKLYEGYAHDAAPRRRPRHRQRLPRDRHLVRSYLRLPRTVGHPRLDHLSESCDSARAVLVSEMMNSTTVCAARARRIAPTSWRH